MLKPLFDRATMKEAEDFGARLTEQEMHKSLLAYAKGLTGERESARDVVQSAYLHALKAFASGQYREDDNLKGYMLRLVRNSFLDEYRSSSMHGCAGKRVRHGRCFSGAESLVAYPDPVAHMLPEALVSLEQATASLPPYLQNVLWTVCVEGKSFAECAAQKQVRPKTIEIFLSRARKNLRSLMIA